MSCHVRARLVCAALLLLCPVADAAPLTIDLPGALARARERAPDAVVARSRIGEANARRAGASVLFTQNPEVQVGAGRRLGDPATLAVQAQLTQPLELARRGPRIRVADAEIGHARAESEAQLRELGFAVTNAFYEARFADFAVELAQRNQEVATRAADATARRRKAGDITDLDVNLAKIALGRARARHSPRRGRSGPKRSGGSAR